MEPVSQEIPRERWHEYFDELSKHLGTVKATVEVAGRDLGAQIEAEDLVLTGLSYDHKDDVVVIGLDSPGGLPEEVEHMVHQPQRIMVATGNGLEMAIDIEDAEDHQTIIRMHEAPKLPAG